MHINLRECLLLRTAEISLSRSVVSQLTVGGLQGALLRLRSKARCGRSTCKNGEYSSRAQPRENPLQKFLLLRRAPRGNSLSYCVHGVMRRVRTVPGSTRAELRVAREERCRMRTRRVAAWGRGSHPLSNTPGTAHPEQRAPSRTPGQTGSSGGEADGIGSAEGAHHHMPRIHTRRAGTVMRLQLQVNTGAHHACRLSLGRYVPM
ncbi:hypothetical protein BV25DRAFT_1710164 [Artomyces pyxidatus]|uniref:Uncharacterized protein n=1 Tax=Artomyces pyxidatus TaxID=48021 RepID=A0ACB8TC18_9AGAM|nr:hypothetical protein BV25DRAFT_1710164 [Artomyces pyxidatus]